VLRIAAALTLPLALLCSCTSHQQSQPSQSTTASASPVGHRWVVENEAGLICYPNAHDLETARSMGGDFEDITPEGFHFTGDQSAGGRLGQGDVISMSLARLPVAQGSSPSAQVVRSRGYSGGRL